MADYQETQPQNQYELKNPFGKRDSSQDDGKSEQGFFSREGNLIADFSQGMGVSFEPGNGWGVNPETGKATYDTKFFKEKGYTEAQAIFATLHEIDHVKELSQLRTSSEGKEISDRRKERAKTERRAHVLENCLLDVADNRRVAAQFPALQDQVTKLYAEKLWPSTDLTKDPKHLQFAYAILRTGMLPDHQVQIDPGVSQAIEGLRHVKGKSGAERDIIQIVTDPNLDPLTKYKLVEKYIEPAYEKLFEEDKKEKSEEHQKNGERGPANPESDFSDNYDKFDSDTPEPLTPEEIEETAATSAGAGDEDISKRQEAAYEKEHGVNQKDVAEYKTEYSKVENLIEGMRQEFRRIVAERLIPFRKLTGFYNEGVMIEPGLIPQALTDLSKGITDPTVFRDFEGRIKKEEVPTLFEVSAVLDRSGSMAMDGKMEEQRRAAILLMESLREFMELPEVRNSRLAPELRTLSEIRSFGGADENVVVKPLSSELSEKQRVDVFKTLGACTGSSTEDYISLGGIVEDMKKRDATEPGYLDKVRERSIKKLVVIFSDGASSNETLFQQRKSELESMGVEVVNYRRITSGANFTSHMSGILADAINNLGYTETRRRKNG